MSVKCTAKRKSTEENVIVVHVKNAEKIYDDCSEEQNISGFPWKIRVSMDEKDGKGKESLGIYLDCAMKGRSNMWFCQASFELILVNQADAKKSISRKMNHRFSYSRSIAHYGINNFGSRSMLLNPEEGFIKDDQIIMQATISVENSSLCKKFRPKATFDVFTPSNNSDGILVVDGTKFYVNKQILTLQSPYFDRLFNGKYKESSQEEIKIEDVEQQDFEELIKAMYPIGYEYADDTVESLLELADRFEINNVLDNAEKFLLESSDLTESKKLYFADKYRLTVLLDKIIAWGCSTTYKIRLLKHTDEYAYLSDALKGVLLDKVLDLLNKTSTKEGALANIDWVYRGLSG